MKFHRATMASDPQQIITDFAEAGHDPEIVAQILKQSEKDELYLSDCCTYQVRVRRNVANGFEASMTWLSIKRVDREPIHDWRALQEIKNALIGAECEAIEIYPAESRLVDSANQYHLWAFDDPQIRIPVGFQERMVTDAPVRNTKQRPLA